MNGRARLSDVGLRHGFDPHRLREAGPGFDHSLDHDFIICRTAHLNDGHRDPSPIAFGRESDAMLSDRRRISQTIEFQMRDAFPQPSVDLEAERAEGARSELPDPRVVAVDVGTDVAGEARHPRVTDKVEIQIVLEDAYYIDLQMIGEVVA